MRKYVAELIGTFAVVFCATGAMVVDQQTVGQIGHAGVAATSGLIVLAMIYTFGETSGAHFNPIVSFGFWVAGRFKGKELIPYIISQLCGALLASLTIKLLFPTNQMLGATIPSGSVMQSFILEIILTFFLMLVIINVSQGSKETGVLAGIAIGTTVLLAAMFGGPISGASMNPVRSLAPALISGNLKTVWIYLTAPVAGSAIAAFTWKLMNAPKKIGF